MATIDANRAQQIRSEMYDTNFGVLEKELLGCLRDMDRLRKIACIDNQDVSSMREIVKVAKDLRHKINEDMDR